jgi:hypothetical protein
MNIMTCYAHGIREATRRPKMIMLLWLANIAFAAAAYFVFSGAFGAALGSSGMTVDMLKKTDMNVIIEVLTNSGGRLGDLIMVVLLIIVFYEFVSIFLNGGILHSLTRPGDEERFGQTFFAGGGRYYGRFFRLTIYSVTLWVPALLGFFIVTALLSAITRDSTNEQLSFYFSLLRIILALFLVFLIKMVMDYARIRIATQDTNKVFASLLEAVQFVFSRFTGTLLLYYLLGLTGWAALLVFRLINGTFTKNTTVAVLLGFVLAQLFIASRGWLRIAYQAAELKFFTR